MPKRVNLSPALPDDAHTYPDDGSHRVTLAHYNDCDTCRAHYDALRAEQAAAPRSYPSKWETYVDGDPRNPCRWCDLRRGVHANDCPAVRGVL